MSVGILPIKRSNPVKDLLRNTNPENSLAFAELFVKLASK